ncbi:MAG: hypothetical protein LBL20_06495 [Treponema sp.]|nr:hypothetical protein [Treponema sp.]
MWIARTGIVKALLLAALIVSSCAGSLPITAASETGRFSSGPGDGTLVVIGVSGRMRREEREIDSALDDAARQIALYQGLKGKATTVLETGGGYRNFYLAIKTKVKPLYESDYAAYRAALRYDREKDLVRTGNAVFIRCAYDMPGLSSLGYNDETVNGKPAWLRGPITIPGYSSAVGFAKKHRRLAETIARSRESAAIALMAGLSSHIETIVADHANRRAAVTTRETIEGELINFMILETWIDPETGSVWTLAAAKKNQEETP